MALWNVVLLLLSGFFLTASGSNILCLSPLPGRSHSILVETVCKALAEKGHQVTFITAYPGETPTPNMTEISTAELDEALQKASRSNMNMFDMRKSRMWLQVPVFFKFMGKHMDDFLQHPNVVKFLNTDNTKFDLIFGENCQNEAVMAGFSRKYKAPMVLISPFQPNLWMNFVVGNPAPTSYIPDTCLVFSDHMTFLERLANTLYTWIHDMVFTFYHHSMQESVYRKHFGDDQPPLREVMKNTSLVLVNHHYSLAFPRPYTPNMVEVAGMHIKPLKPLPKDFQIFMDEAKDGVIFFSLGSHIPPSKMPKEKLDAFIEVFGKLKEKVIWKWDADELPNKPANVKISKWVPQSDILAHPNLKLFITHNGLGSTIESVYRGVLTLSVPIFGDQQLNARHMEKAGVTKVLELDDINADMLREAITEVTTDPKYKENVQKRSALLKDRPVSGIDTAIYWIEYVIRHEGAVHMRSAAQDLSWYQLYLFDVYFTIFVVLGLVVYLQVFIVRKICRRFCKKNKQEVEEKKKKN